VRERRRREMRARRGRDRAVVAEDMTIAGEGGITTRNSLNSNGFTEGIFLSVI
jgi:hypothetical protein